MAYEGSEDCRVIKKRLKKLCELADGRCRVGVRQGGYTRFPGVRLPKNILHVK